ncbi:leukocyte surface antigen CD53 [Planococcus citri]|uniref:leukocyte surface antigen CD53 n=1 Tax=Planococcus citri TaxID=170843 RepID=UPI0031F80616
MNDSSFKYCFFNFVNFLYLVCGLCLVAGSIIILTDSERILISRLIPINSNEPILYYICMATLLLGLLISVLSTVGCWATYTDNYCLFSIYVFGVIVLLLGESVMGVVTAICPEYLGLKFNKESLSDVWQRNYGVPGREQYTVAIDLIQVKLECCGVSSGKDYLSSIWHAEKLAAPNLTVPISCCHLDQNQTKSFLDPVPLDITTCQQPESEKIHTARHIEGCIIPLENWLREQKTTILLTALINLGIQLLILFAVITTCIRSKPMTYDSTANKRISTTKY